MPFQRNRNECNVCVTQCRSAQRSQCRVFADVALGAMQRFDRILRAAMGDVRVTVCCFERAD
jgi:hypothetical protein